MVANHFWVSIDELTKLIVHFFCLCRHSAAVKRTTKMLGRAYGITGFPDSGAAGFFSTTRRSGIGLQQELRQIGQKFTITAQRTKTQVSLRYTNCPLVEPTKKNSQSPICHRREQWPMFSSYACWQQLVNQTKSLSKDHAALSEIYSTHLVARLQTVIEDVQRIYKKCREIGYETHEEILRVLQELHTTMKTYHSYQVCEHNRWGCF